MKYLTEYQRIVRRWKVYTAILVAFLLSLLRSGTHILGVQYVSFSTTAKAIGLCSDIFVVLLMLPPYGLAALVVRKHVNSSVSSHLLSKVAQPVNAIAFRRVIATVLLYIPVVVLALMNRYLSKHSPIRQYESFLFMWSVSYGFMGFTSFVNALIFISINSKCRRQIIRRFSTYRVESSLKNNKEKMDGIQTISGRIDMSSIEMRRVVESYDKNGE